MHQPSGAAFDAVLLLHVGCALVGLVTTLAATTTAGRLERSVSSSSPPSEPLRRYFRPGFNWAGRIVYGIPVFGFVLVAMSGGDYALSEGWVLGGVALFVGVALLGEGVLWPAERRLQRAVTAAGAADVAGATQGSVSDAAAFRDARTMRRAGGAVLVLLVAGMVLMVAQP